MILNSKLRPAAEPDTDILRGKCGSTAVDRTFLRLLEKKVGPLFESLPTGRKDSGSRLIKAFHIAQLSFGTTSQDQTWFIPLGDVEDSPENGIESGELTLTMYVRTK